MKKLYILTIGIFMLVLAGSAPALAQTGNTRAYDDARRLHQSDSIYQVRNAATDVTKAALKEAEQELKVARTNIKLQKRSISVP